MKSIRNIIIGIGEAFLVTLVALSLVVVILTYSNVSEEIAEPLILIISAVSILIGSFLQNKKLHKNGLLNGIIIAIAYFFILYIISSILTGNFGLSIKSLIMIIIGVICGIAGGILGVNIKSKK